MRQVTGLLFVGIAALAGTSAAPRAQAAGAAYQVDTAEVSDPGSCKIESWASFASNQDFIGAVSPACVVNLGRPIEFSAQFNRSRADGEWGTAVTPKLKTNLLPSGIGQWGVAVTGTASIDLVTGDTIAWTVTLPATLRLSEVMRVNVNAGYQRDLAGRRDYFAYGAGIDLRTPDNVWTLTAEMFGQAGAISDDDPRSLIRPRWQAGLALAADRQLQPRPDLWPQPHRRKCQLAHARNRDPFQADGEVNCVDSIIDVTQRRR